MTGDNDVEPDTNPAEDPLITIYETMTYTERKSFMREWGNRFQGESDDWQT